MEYISTRAKVPPVPFSKAVEHGLAPDGGLYIPSKLPNLKPYLNSWKKLSYVELSKAFFSIFATDIPKQSLNQIIENSYNNFDNEIIAPLNQLDDNLFVLELFHGPTLAFKDFALQLLGNLYDYQISATGKSITILGATSGDTGAAAIHGLLEVENAKTFILYPKGRISKLQERQMTCTLSSNVYPLAIKGSFDDAQTAMKKVFEDREFSEKVGLSAVNSINLARILAQCVYYLYSFFKLPENKREEFTFIVPTGNFGNVLAGWLVQKMGVPIRSFTVATNQNDILHRLFQTGIYSQGKVLPSLAPSMDIQVASNFERFLYYSLGEKGNLVDSIIKEFKEKKEYKFKDFDKDTFLSKKTIDSEINQIIKEVYDAYGYVVDPHTACGFSNLTKNPSVVLATAHPSKFPDTIKGSIGLEILHPSLEVLKSREPLNYEVKPNPEAIKEFILKY